MSILTDVDYAALLNMRQVGEAASPATAWKTLQSLLTTIQARLDARLVARQQAPATGAQAVILDGKIVISIDVDALPIVVSGSCASDGLSGLWSVTDAEVFAKEVCHSLNDEREDGTTRVHLMFDSAFQHAIEQGAEGIDEVSEDDFEAECSRFHALPERSVVPLDDRAAGDTDSSSSNEGAA